jgi:transcriptional regulator with XRE-family HTH domain
MLRFRAIRMPASKEVHCLALMRKILRLKQSELAALAECSVATIQSIELNRLKLSKGLATRISLATGVNYDWLLDNDIKKPMPPLPRFDTNSPEESVQSNTIFVLQILFEWLFVIAARQPKTPVRFMLELYIELQLDYLKKSEGDPELETAFGTNVFEFFAKHPDLLDPDLKKIINIDNLIKDQRQRRKQGEKESREFNRKLRAIKAKPTNQLSAEDIAFVSAAERTLKDPGKKTSSRRSGQIRQQQEPVKESPKARKARSQNRQLV